jgi:hypothetical protein
MMDVSPRTALTIVSGKVTAGEATGVPVSDQRVAAAPFVVRRVLSRTSRSVAPAPACQVRSVMRLMPVASTRCSAMLPFASPIHARSPEIRTVVVAPVP